MSDEIDPIATEIERCLDVIYSWRNVPFEEACVHMRPALHKLVAAVRASELPCKPKMVCDACNGVLRWSRYTAPENRGHRAGCTLDPDPQTTTWIAELLEAFGKAQDDSDRLTRANPTKGTEILIVETERPDPRVEIVGWTHEDASLVVPGKPIGFTPAPSEYACYSCVLRAIADGWRLLAPPERFLTSADRGKELYGYTWWLVR